MVTPAARREAVRYLRDRYPFSERRACQLAGAARSMARYRSKRSDLDLALRGSLERLAALRPRFGYRRLHVLLHREGVLANRKRVYRIYRAAGLAVQLKHRKRVAQANRQPRVVAREANDQWTMDFMRDTLADGRVFRLLNVLDEALRKALAMEVDTSLPGARVARVLDRLVESLGAPRRLIVDNGPEFTGKELDQWAHRHRVELIFIRPGRPVENCFIESFNGRVRDECLNLHWFTSLADARRTIELWRLDYNHVRPHSSLYDLSPVAHAEGAGLRPNGSASAPPPPPNNEGQDTDGSGLS
jgi:putative transposase